MIEPLGAPLFFRGKQDRREGLSHRRHLVAAADAPVYCELELRRNGITFKKTQELLVEFERCRIVFQKPGQQFLR